MSAHSRNTDTKPSTDLHKIVDTDETGVPVMPEARVTIDLVPDPETGEWVAYDPADLEGLEGRADTAPLAAADYCQQVADHLEEQANE